MRIVSFACNVKPLCWVVWWVGKRAGIENYHQLVVCWLFPKYRLIVGLTGKCVGYTYMFHHLNKGNNFCASCLFPVHQATSEKRSAQKRRKTIFPNYFLLKQTFFRKQFWQSCLPWLCIHSGSYKHNCSRPAGMLCQLILSLVSLSGLWCSCSNPSAWPNSCTHASCTK